MSSNDNLEPPNQPPPLNYCVAGPVMDEALSLRGIVPCELHRSLLKHHMTNLSGDWLLAAVDLTAETLERNN